MSVFLQTAAPTFALADIGRTIRWYREHLELDADTFPDHEPYQWAVRDPNRYILVFGDDAPDVDVPGLPAEDGE